MADSYLAFVGTFAGAGEPGIYRYRADAGTGELRQLGTVDAGEEPSFLAFGPDGERLYAANNTDDGTARAFSVDREAGELSELNRGPTGGNGPCHCSVDATGNYLLVAHYHGGSVSMVSLSEDGRIDGVADTVEREGSGVDPERQEAPHPHSIYPGPENRFAYAPDLGTDEIAVYEMDLEAGRLVPADPPAVEIHDGAGPRHLDFHPNGRVVYLINELDSTLTTLEYDPETGGLAATETVGTLPDGFEGTNYPADVHVHPSGEYLYGSNRGHDSIAVFELDADGGPTLVDHTSTQGEWPRNFALDPAGRHLFAENEETDDVVGFRIGEDGRLSATGQVLEVPTPVCMKLVAAE